MTARRSAAFTQLDIQRAFKAAGNAGVPVAVRVEAATGDLLIFPCQPVTMVHPAPDPEDIDAMIQRAKL